MNHRDQNVPLLRVATSKARASVRGRFLRSSAWSLATRVLNTLLVVATSVLLARLMGPADFGTYSFMLALATVLAVPAKFGLPSLVIRETAKAQASGEWPLMKGVWRWSSGVTLAITAVLVVAVGAVAYGVQGRLSQSEVITMVLAVVLVPFMVIGDLRGAALRGLQRVILGQLPEMILRPGLHLCAIVALIAISARAALQPQSVMALHVGAAILALLIASWILRRSQPGQLAGVSAQYRSAAWVASALPLAMTTGMQVVNKYTDILMLGVMGSAEDVGIYRVAAQGVLLAAMGLQAMNMLIAPRISLLNARGDQEGLRKLVQSGSTLTLLLSLPPILAFIFAGRPILGAVFGPEYVSAYVPLAILCVGQLVNAAMGCVGTLLNMTGHERETARGMAVGAGGNVILNLLLIPPFGMTGAAVATSVTVIIWNLMLRRAALKALHIESLAVLGLLVRRPDGQTRGLNTTERHHAD